jgi:peptide/nickel transport system substrate-binding protein
MTPRPPSTFSLAPLVLLATTCACERPLPEADTLTLAIASAPEALDPRFATSAVATRLSALIVAPLVVIGDDLRPQPLLADSLAWPDERTLLVRVKEGLRFHDGTQLLAHDVVATFRTMKDPAMRSPHRGKLEPLTDVSAIDDRTVQFRFDAPFPSFAVDLVGYGILPESCARDVDRCRHHPIGAGPYRIARALDADERLRLEAHDAGPFGAPPIRAIEVRVVRDNTTRLLELLDGRTDLVVGDLLPTDLEALAGHPRLAIETARGVGFTYLALNTRRGELADVRVRRAIAHAIDVDTIIRTKLRGRAVRATSLLPPDHWAHDANLEPLRYDPALARALLQEVGRAPHLSVATTTDRLRRSIALIFAASLRDVGFDVDVVVRDWAALYQDIQVGAFDAFSAKWTPVIDPDLMHWVFHSSNIPSTGRAGGNRSGYANEQVDKVLQRARATSREEERVALYRSIEPTLRDDVPLIPLWFDDEVAVHSVDVVGFELSRTASLLPIARARLERQKGGGQAPALQRSSR